MTLTWQTGDGTVVPLDGTEGVAVLNGTAGFDVPPVELQIEQRVAFDGGVVFRRRMPPRPVTLRLELDETVMTMRQLAAMFADPSASGTLIATTNAVERTLESVVYESGLEGDSSSDRGYGLGWRDVTVGLLAMDPWWLGPQETADLNFAAATGFNAAVGFNDSLTPFNGGDSKTVPVAGDTAAFPVFVIDGPFTTLTVVHPASLESIELSAALADGDQIVIDATPGNRGPRLNGGDVDWSLLTPASRLFTLVPTADTVSINSTGSSGNSAVEVRWRNRYLVP